jgi:hypothetical protein
VYLLFCDERKVRYMYIELHCTCQSYFAGRFWQLCLSWGVLPDEKTGLSCKFRRTMLPPSSGLKRVVSQIRSQFTADGRSVSLSWLRAPSGTHDQIFALVWTVVVLSTLGGSLSPRHGASSGCGWREVIRVRRVAANILNKQSRTADKSWSSSLGV